MEDQAIIDLYWNRDQQAIEETDTKYGSFCRNLSFRVLNSHEDALECVNDTYLAAWEAMPPHRPNILQAFLAKLTRRISIKRYRANAAQKRGGGQIPLALEELLDCASNAPAPEDAAIAQETRDAFNRFLSTLPEVEREVFLRRYFFLDTVPEIAGRYHFSESKVSSMLRRTRAKLKARFEKEGLL